MGGDGTLESSVDGRLASIFEHFDTMLTQCCLSSVTTLHWPIASHFLCVPMWVVWEKMAWTSHIKVQDVLIAQKWAKIFSLEIFKIGKVKCGTKHLPFSASKNAHAHPPPKKWHSGVVNGTQCHAITLLPCIFAPSPSLLMHFSKYCCKIERQQHSFQIFVFHCHTTFKYPWMGMWLILI